MAYPSSLDTFAGTTAQGTNLLTSPDHAADHRTLGSAAAALEQKLGIGSGTPKANYILTGTGNGTAVWGTEWDSGILGTALVMGGTVGTALIQGGTSKALDMRGYFSTPISSTATAGGTVNLDLSLSNEFRVTFGTGNATLTTSNPTNGEKFIVSLTQDAVGARTVTWFSGISWVAAGTPDLTTTANKKDTLGFVCTSGTSYDGFIVGQDI